ncbi:MAG: TPM domain-containing protein [Prevotella sp.]|nr:TPM domain-containing protein [Prevotella sp.]
MRVRLFRFLWVCAFVLVAVSVQAKVWTADDVSMVHLEDRTKYVSDPESLLTAAMRDSTNLYLRKLHVECGVQTVFVVVGNVANADCFRMAQDIGNKYGVGTKAERRGLVIVLAVNDRKYFIAPGKGLEGDLPDITCDDIARACIVKNMKLNNVDLAVLQTSQAIYNKLKVGKTGIQQVDQAEEMTVSDWLVIIFFLFIFFGAPIMMLIRFILETFGIIKKRPRDPYKRRNDDDDWIPPFIFGGGGGFGAGGGGPIGGSFGGGSFGGGGAGGGW